MKKYGLKDAGEDLADFATDTGKSIGRWFAKILGISAVAGSVGTITGLILGAPFYPWALICGASAIIIVLALYLFLISGAHW